MNKRVIAIITLIVFALVIGFSVTRGQAPTLQAEAAYVTVAPAIDGNIVDPVWAEAQAINIQVRGQSGDKDVELKFLYTDTDLYVLAQWPDPTLSIARGGSWLWDGTQWKALLGSAEAVEAGLSGISEDRIAVMWNMNIAGFDVAGCSATCHAQGHWANQPETFADLWHMKAARCLPLYRIPGEQAAFAGYSDDTFVGYNADPTRYNLPDAGRYFDFGVETYYHNRNADKTAPLYIETNPVDYFDAMVLSEVEIKSGEAVLVASLTPAEISTYWARYNAFVAPMPASYPRAVVPERILRGPSGSRADVVQGGKWSEGRWTVEFKRALVTDHFDDLQFSDLTKAYLFDIAIMDNAGGEGHSFHVGTPAVLTFEPKR